MKQSPFKFQGNTSKQAAKAKAEAPKEHDDAQGKPAVNPKDIKRVQTKARTNVTVRTGRPVNAQRPKGKG
ncbi:MAG: hypothetical protein ABIQ02_02290 [Saprospiraceae bacterium]